jgi:hypothetical protein
MEAARPFHYTDISGVHEAVSSVGPIIPPAGLLPPDYYALAERIAGGFGPDVLTLGSARAAPDLVRGEATTPPKVRFTATAETERYARKQSHIAIRHSMPLFFEPDRYVPVPLETSYQAAFEAVPKRWQRQLETSPDG